MTYIITPILGMQLADPLTIQAFEPTVVNSNFLALENGIGADRTRLTTLEAKSAIRSGTAGFADFLVADLAALASLSALAGDIARVTSMSGCVFRCTGTTNWVQEGVATFATAAARDTEYAKAAGAYLVQGAQVRQADTGVSFTYYALYNSGTNPNGATPAGWYPTPGQDIFLHMDRATFQVVANNATQALLGDTFGGLGVPRANSPMTLATNLYSNQFFTWDRSTGLVVPKFAGTYDIAAVSTWPTNSAGVDSMSISKTSAGAIMDANTLSYDILAASAGVTATLKTMAKSVPLLTTDTFRVLLNNNAGSVSLNVGQPGFPANLMLDVRYVGPLHQ